MTSDSKNTPEAAELASDKSDVRSTSPELKLFVWQDVLRDYTSGMVCILAHDLEEALELARNKFDAYIVEGFAGHPYEVITEPDAFYVYGGG